MSTERWTDERLDRLSMNLESLVRVVQLQQGNMEEMRLQQQEMNERYQEMNTRLTEISTQLVQNVTELRAGQERQERLLDYLIRRDGQRGEDV
jgi:predicted  nucleic acid-binding Zn-ribbon protein